MSEATPADGNNTAPIPQSPIRLLGQFIKDFSFEVPHAPEIFQEMRDKTPEIAVEMDNVVRHLSGSAYEVVMSVHIDASVPQKKAFLLELSYCAVVDINVEVVPEAHIHPVLLIEVPRQLFPFVRQIVGETIGNGGFPPLMLQLIDFADLYRRKFGDAEQLVPRNDAPQPSVH